MTIDSKTPSKQIRSGVVFLLLLVLLYWTSWAWACCTREGTRMIWVRDRQGRLEAIYADRELTIPMANPVLPDVDGSFRFCTRWGCVEEGSTGN